MNTDEENTHPSQMSDSREVASKLMDCSTFDRSNSNTKNLLCAICFLSYLGVIHIIIV